jgi:hypothetical protein
MCLEKASECAPITSADLGERPGTLPRIAALDLSERPRPARVEYGHILEVLTHHEIDVILKP